MATYVNNLRLKEITTGDEDGTWGTSTNTNLELIGEALGYGTKQMAADADETFTMPDASTDGSRALYLKITSAVSLTTTRVVTLGPNTVSKFWIIENATSGSQDITIKQGSGATVNVPNGNKVYLYTDGAGAGAAVANAEPSSASGGTVTSVGGTGTVNGLTLTGTVTSSGNLTLGGTLANVDLTSAVTGTLPTANGGTSFNSYTQGDVIYASGTNTLAKLPIGGANQVLSVNSGGTALEYATISAGVATRTASGAITAGDTVAMNSDGTVSTITGLVQSEVFGLQLDAGDTKSEQSACAYDPTSNKMMIVYRKVADNTYYGVVGTVSGQSITFGSPVSTGIVDTGDLIKNTLIYNAQEDRFVSFMYTTTSSLYKVIAGQIIGTTISWGTAVDMASGSNRLDAVNIDGTSNILAAYLTGSNHEAVVVSLSGSTVTVGTPVTVKSGSGTAHNVGLCYNADDNEYGFTFNSNNDQYYSFITVSGTTPTATTPVVGQQTAARDSDIVWHRGHQQYISFVVYNNTGAFPSSNYGIECRQFTQSGGTITTINTHNITASANTGERTLGAIYEPNSTDVYVTYQPQVDFNGTSYQKQTLLPLTIKASSIVNGDLYDLGDSNNTSYAGLALDPDNKQILVSCTKWTADYNFAQAVRPYVFSSTFNNYFGIANANIADAASGTINILGGVDNNQTGLTAGSKYYVNWDGSLVTRETPVIAGFATSATSLLLLKPSDVLIQRDQKVALSAISAGDAVFVNDDYSVTTFTETYQWNSWVASSGTHTESFNQPWYLCYAGGDKYVMFYRDVSSQLRVFVWQISGTTWTPGSTITTVLSTNGGPYTNANPFDAMYNSYADCVCWHHATNTNGYDVFGKFNVNAAGTAIENASTTLDYGGQYGFYAQIAVNPNNGKMIVTRYQNSAGNMYPYWWDQPNKTSTPSIGGCSSQVVGTGQGGGGVCWMPTHNEFLIVGWNTSNQAVLHAVDGTATGNPGASTATATFSISNNTYSYGAINRIMEWSETHQQAIASFAGSSPTPASLRVAFFNYDGTTITNPNQIDLYILTNAAGGYATAWQNYNDAFFRMFPVIQNGVQAIYMKSYNGWFEFTWNRNAVSGNGELTWIRDRTTGSYGSNHNVDFNEGRFEWGRVYTSSTSYTAYGSSAGTTNYLDFCGLASNSASANEYVNIDITGSVNEDQTGLTAGTVYYMAANGALTTAETDAKVGVALNSSNILVKL